MLGKTLRRVGEHDAGLAALERAQRIKPGRSYIELELCAALIDADRRQEAAEHLHRGQRGARGWLAWKAARLALTLKRVEDARRLLAQAGRERAVRHSDQYAQLKAGLDAATPPDSASDPGRYMEDGASPTPSAGQASEGVIDHVRPERGFGFLTDDADDVRCHFKLRGAKLRKGQRVRFVRADIAKGPAAQDVRPLTSSQH